jgi:hypothetical protein
MPVILATQEAEIRRIKVRSQPGKRVYPSQKRASGVAEGVGPAFKPQYRKTKQAMCQSIGEEMTNASTSSSALAAAGCPAHVLMLH